MLVFVAVLVASCRPLAGLRPVGEQSPTSSYRFRSGAVVSPTGSFKTAYSPATNATVTFAFTGDADWKWKPYPLLTSLVKERLDFFLFLGDLIYESTNQGDTAPTSVEDL